MALHGAGEEAATIKLCLLSPNTGYYAFHCPGCGYLHGYYTKPHKRDGQDMPVWAFNGDMERPTFTPSLLVNAHDPKTRCHLFLTDGKLHYCSDSHHKLAGQTVDCPEWQ